MSWETRLTTLLEGLTLLQAYQRRWLYLEPIFGRGALPTVAGRFRHVDGEFKAIMLQLQVSSGPQPELCSMLMAGCCNKAAVTGWAEHCNRAASPQYHCASHQGASYVSHLHGMVGKVNHC
jgi:hypothetical protein